MAEKEKHPGFAKADAIVLRIFRYISYPPAILLIIVALVATVNVVTSKTIKWIVPSNIDWITYLLIPIVFLSLAHVQLDRGLVVVDFVNTHYPKWLKKGMDIVCNALLVLLNGFIGWRGFVLMASKYALKEMSSTDTGSFFIWPFCFLLGFGMFCFAFTSFWSILRILFGVTPNATEAATEAKMEQKSIGGDTE